jgi:hypothetical protein
LILIAGCGIPFLIYEIWAVKIDPVLSEWHAQNLTPSPPLGNAVLSLSPPLILALLGVKRTWQSSSGRVLLYWFILGAALIYFPWSLQRRFLSGYYIPLSGMAVLGIRTIENHINIKYRTMGIILIILALPTNLIVLTSAIQAVQNQNQRIYLYQDEVEAFDWIKENTQKDMVILAAPETGLFIPAYTGRQVIYGHPFETTQAENKEENVRDFYGGEWTNNESLAFLENYEINYVFYGPREEDIGTISNTDQWRLAYRNLNVKIFKINP